MNRNRTASFDDEITRRVYEYVERNGAVEPTELVRSIRIDAETSQSKPARSGTYTESLCPPTEDLESCLETLEERGYLTRSNGTVRVALPATAKERSLSCDDGTVTIRPAREGDREGIVETMRSVADEGPYIVAEDVAARLEGESALVRANEARSRVCFAAVLESGSESHSDSDSDNGADTDDEPAAQTPASDTDGDGEIVGWLHLDAHERPARSHAAELTVGVAPDQRRQGIGSSLLEYGLEWAAEAGYHKCYQRVPATNDEAIAFLEDSGWEREGVHAEQYRIDDAFVDEVLLATWPANDDAEDA